MNIRRVDREKLRHMNLIAKAAWDAILAEDHSSFHAILERQQMATEIAAILGEPVTAQQHGNGVHYLAANGNGFMLLSQSRATPEQIAECLRP